MNLEELRTVQSKERQTDSLQHLRPSFYREVGEYIGELEDERERAAARAADPFSSPEVARLTDEIESAKDVVEAIYERRMGKLVKGASLAAAGMPADEDGLTAEERELFVDLVDRIETNKSRVLEVLDGRAPADAAESEVDPSAADPARSGTSTVDPPEAPGPASEAVGSAARGETGASPPPTDGSRRGEPTGPDDGRPADDGIDAAEAMGASRRTESAGAPLGAEPTGDAPGAEPASDSSETESGDAPGAEPIGDGSGVGRRTVRIVRDVGSILGVDDREYTLESDDVVTLPEQNATPLIDRDAAEPLE